MFPEVDCFLPIGIQGENMGLITMLLLLVHCYFQEEQRDIDSTRKAALKSRMKTVSYCIASSSLVFHTKNRLIQVSQLQILSWACCSLCLQHLVRTNFPKSHPQLQALHKAPVYIASCFPVVYPQLLDLHKASVTSPTFSPQTAFISNYVCIQPYGVGAIALWHHHCRLVTTA